MTIYNGMFWGPTDPPQFIAGLQQAVNTLPLPREGIYAADNLFTYNRNLSFLEDSALMSAFNEQATTIEEKAFLWRTSVILWGVRHGLKLQGDFVECGCYKGTTVRIVCDTVRFATHGERRYWLYDLFEHDADMPHHAMPEHGENLHAQTQARFSDYSNVTVIRGRIPDVLEHSAPKEIVFTSVGVNNAAAEVAVL
ncbi:hypothetical protein ACQV5M_19800 [Leptospira sp. SA-E8]|uniref:hypothetical protein n=1 Tax=Leptospira sp. SA-E8 TaxID=3422259 RepID=UPI003EB8EC58